MSKRTCDKCGLDHARLGCTIERGILRRHLDSTRGHLVKIAGGGIAFRAPLIEGHPEIFLIEVEDQGTGTHYAIDRPTFDAKSFRQTLHPAYGPQLVLPLRDWKIVDPHRPGDGAQLVQAAADAQPRLFENLPGVLWYKRATEPRPRRPHPRRR